MTLGEKIRQTRKGCGLSQEQLAEKLCVSRSAIAKWETDKGLPDVGNLKVLARLLGVSVDYLLDEAEQPGQAVLRESYNLAAYGPGCKKVKKDRVVREKFPDGKICPLLGRQELIKVDKALFGPMDCAMSAGVKNFHREFYLVEKGDRQFLVTVTDEFIQTRLLETPIRQGSFSLDGWNFIKCNYRVE